MKKAKKSGKTRKVKKDRLPRVKRDKNGRRYIKVGKKKVYLEDKDLPERELIKFIIKKLAPKKRRRNGDARKKKKEWSDYNKVDQIKAINKSNALENDVSFQDYYKELKKQKGVPLLMPPDEKEEKKDDIKAPDLKEQVFEELDLIPFMDELGQPYLDQAGKPKMISSNMEEDVKNVRKHMKEQELKAKQLEDEIRKKQLEQNLSVEELKKIKSENKTKLEKRLTEIDEKLKIAGDKWTVWHNFRNDSLRKLLPKSVKEQYTKSKFENLPKKTLIELIEGSPEAIKALEMRDDYKLWKQAVDTLNAEKRQYEDEIKGLTEEKKGVGLGKYGTGDGLTNEQIDRVMKRYPWYIDTIPRDGIRKYIKPYARQGQHMGFIMNNQKENKAGEHWVAVYITPETVEYFDSFAEPVFKDILDDLKEITDIISPDKLIKLKENKIKNQSVKSDNCGYFAMKFLIDRAVHKKPFKDVSGFSDVMKSEKELEKYKDTFKPFKYLK